MTLKRKCIDLANLKSRAVEEQDLLRQEMQQVSHSLLQKYNILETAFLHSQIEPRSQHQMGSSAILFNRLRELEKRMFLCFEMFSTHVDDLIPPYHRYWLPKPTLTLEEDSIESAISDSIDDLLPFLDDIEGENDNDVDPELEICDDNEEDKDSAFESAFSVCS